MNKPWSTALPDADSECRSDDLGLLIRRDKTELEQSIFGKAKSKSKRDKRCKKQLGKRWERGRKHCSPMRRRGRLHDHYIGSRCS